MKIYACFILSAFLAGMISVPAAAKGIFPYEHKERVLSNGFKIIVIPMESGGLVSYYSIVRTGSRDETEPGHSGFAHFFEHMMFRGTEKVPGPVYDRHMTEMGADANAFTSRDITCYHLNLAAGDLEKVMELESDRFQNLSYPEEVFKTEAGAVYGEYLKSLSSPFSVLQEKLMDTAFEKHTYKHTTIGFGDDVRAMPAMYDYSIRFFERYYKPENVVLLVAGQVKPEEVFKLAEKYYGSWEMGYVPPQIPAEPRQKRERRERVAFNGKTLPVLAVAYKGLAFDPENMELAACILMGDLMFGETSELYKKLVIEEQRVQFIGADFSPNRDPGLMTITSMINQKSDIGYVEEEIYKTIEKTKRKAPDEARVQALKSHIRYGFLMRLETPENVASSLTELIAMTGGIEAVDRLYSTLDKVKPKDIQEAARDFLVKERRTVIVLEGR